jgi:hypothetical protein
MRHRAWLAFVFAVLVAVGVGAWMLWTWALPDEGRSPEEGLRDVTPTRTAVVPTLDTPIPEGKSALWCASFQLAWEHFRKDVTRGPVELDGAEEAVKRLNGAPSVAGSVQADDVYAAGGFVRDGIAERIEQEMAQRFPGVPTPRWGPEDVCGAFAYLRASLKFTRRYANNKKPLPFTGAGGEKTQVRSFGIPFNYQSRSGLFEQIALLHATSRWRDGENSFILDPCKDSLPYQLLLAQVPRQKTLAAALADVAKRCELAPAPEDARRFDSFFVPHFRFRIAHWFGELEGRALLNPPTKGLFLSRAEQHVDFALDASGAKLESRAYPAGAKGGPSELHFDQPFLLVMRKRGGPGPFLVLWVENDELLEPW